MTQSATIDTLSYLNTMPDTQSASKTSADSAADFANVFNNVNKTYSPKDESANSQNNTTAKAQKKPSTDAQTSGTKIDDNNSPKNQPQSDETAPQKATADKASESKPNIKTINIKEAAEESIRERLAAEKNANTTNTKTTDAGVLALETAAAKIKFLKEESNAKSAKAENDLTSVLEDSQTTESTDTTEITPEDETDTQTETIPAQQPTSTESTSTMTNEITLPTQTDNMIELLAAAPSATDSTTKATTDTSNNVASVQNSQIQTAQNDFDVNLTTSTKTLNDLITSQASKIKSQPQTQPELKITDSTQQNQVSQATTTTADTTTAQDTAAVKAPVIQVNTELLASNATILKPDDTNAKNVLDKTALTQEMINKTNATVVSVESSSSANANANPNAKQNQNNSLNQQSAQEQAIKLSIEDNSTTQATSQNIAISSATTTASTAPTDFAKTLETSQTTTQPQVTKELSQTDIMSQVHSKLNTLEETGTNKINIILRPEHLGKISVELVNTQDGMTAKMTAENAQVKEILDKSLDSLKDTLGSQGINVTSVSVKVENTQKQDMYSFEDNQSNGKNQGSTGNNPNQNQDESSFDEEMDNAISTIGTDSEAEKTVSVGSGKGKVDYKV